MFSSEGDWFLSLLYRVELFTCVEDQHTSTFPKTRPFQGKIFSWKSSTFFPKMYILSNFIHISNLENDQYVPSLESMMHRLIYVKGIQLLHKYHILMITLFALSIIPLSCCSFQCLQVLGLQDNQGHSKVGQHYHVGELRQSTNLPNLFIPSPIPCSLAWQHSGNPVDNPNKIIL